MMFIFPQISFQIGLALLIFLVINFIGKNSKISLQYSNLSEIASSYNISYNIFLRILAPSVLITFVVIGLYKTNLEHFIKDIFVVVPIYSVILLAVLIFTKRIFLINIFAFLFIHVFSFLVSFFLYKAAWSKGLNFILPDASNFRSELWIIFILFLYTLLNNFQFSDKNEEQRKYKYIKKHYIKLKQKYSDLLKPEFKKNVNMQNIFFSIMLIEDFNRNALLRFLENLFHTSGFVKTTGIMQVKSDNLLSNEESIKKAQDIIWRSYVDNSQEEYQILSEVSEKYNKGHLYAYSVWDVYQQIKKIHNEYLMYKSNEYTKALEKAINSAKEIINPGTKEEITIDVFEKESADIIKESIRDLGLQVVVSDKEKEERELKKVNEEYKEFLNEQGPIGTSFAPIFDFLLEVGRNSISIIISTFIFTKIAEDAGNAIWEKIKKSFISVFSQLKTKKIEKNISINVHTGGKQILFILEKTLSIEDFEIAMKKIPEVVLSHSGPGYGVGYIFNSVGKEWEIIKRGIKLD